MFPLMQEKRADHSLELQLFASGVPASELPASIERRSKRRIAHAFHVRIWGVDSGDLPFKLDCVVDNISPGSVYLVMPSMMQVGADVRMILTLSLTSRPGDSVALYGTIVRSEKLEAGSHGIAVKLRLQKFL